MTPIRSVLVRDLCVQKPLPCEADTTSCNSTGGRPTCSCLAAFIPSPYSSTSCKGETATLADCAAFKASFYQKGSGKTLVCFSSQCVKVEPGRMVPNVCRECASLHCVLFTSLLQLNLEDLVDDFSRNVPF